MIKQIDVLTGTLAINTTPNITLLNGIEIGTTYYNRIGRKIDDRNIQLSGYFRLTGTATTNTDEARIIILYDIQSNGALPTSTDILLDQNSVGATSTTILSGHNYNNQERFIILYDERYYLPTSTGIPESNTDFNIEINIPLELETQYKGDTSNVTDIATGSIVLMTVGSIVTGSEAWNLSIKTRLLYEDI